MASVGALEETWIVHITEATSRPYIVGIAQVLRSLAPVEKFTKVHLADPNITIPCRLDETNSESLVHALTNGGRFLFGPRHF